MEGAQQATGRRTCAGAIQRSRFARAAEARRREVLLLILALQSGLTAAAQSMTASGGVEVRVVGAESAKPIEAGGRAGPITATDGDLAAALPDAGSAADVRVVAPSLGRPVFVAPGETFDAFLDQPIPLPGPQFELRTARHGGIRHVLARQPVSEDSPTASAVARLKVPSAAAPGVYDLVIVQSGAPRVARHCVSVGPVGETIRVVHLSDMNIGDPTAPDFDHRLPAEVDLLGPTVIVATGDLVDATHPRPEQAWLRAADFLASFDAPVIVARGDQDDAGLFSQTIAASPIGQVAVGPHRFLILHDHCLAPLSGDADQLKWLTRQLSTGVDGATVLVGHHDSTDLARLLGPRAAEWAERVQAWLVGGHVDGDPREFRRLRAALRTPVLRTAQSSTATRGGASGTSSYRVFDLSRRGLSTSAGRTDAVATMPSSALGRLRCRVAPDDGVRSGGVAIDLVNGSDAAVNGLRVRFTLGKGIGGRPTCPGADAFELHDLGDRWLCSASFRLPDRGALRTVAGGGPRDPAPPIDVRIDAPAELTLARVETADQVAYYAGRGAAVRVSLRLPDGAAACEVRPLVRLDGDPIAYRRVGKVDEPFVTMDTLRVEPGPGMLLELDFSAIRARPGARSLQVTLVDRAIRIPVAREIELRLADGAAAAPREE